MRGDLRKRVRGDEAMQRSEAEAKSPPNTFTFRSFPTGCAPILYYKKQDHCFWYPVLVIEARKAL